MITRNSNIAILPWFAALALFRRLTIRPLLQTAAATLIPLAIQAILFYFMNGGLGFNGYGNQAFTADWEGMRNVLFSSWRGLFVFHPIYFFMVILNLRYVVKNSNVRILSIGSLLCFMGAWIINGTWWCWWFGVSFGNRAFVEFLVPLGLAWCAAWAQTDLSHRTQRVLPRLVILSLTLNMVVWSGYLLKRYSHEDPISLSDTYLWWKKNLMK